MCVTVEQVHDDNVACNATVSARATGREADRTEVHLRAAGHALKLLAVLFPKVAVDVRLRLVMTRVHAFTFGHTMSASMYGTRSAGNLSRTESMTNWISARYLEASATQRSSASDE